MTAFISFTSTFRGFIKGAVNPVAADKFAFGCPREHVFQRKIPMEVTWLNRDLPAIYGRDASESEVDLDIKEKWQDFLQLISQAEQQGRINWQIGNYLKYCNEHPDAFWYQD